MKKLILISLFALVSLRLSAQTVTCVDVSRVELKTWSETFKKHVVTESFNTHGVCRTCISEGVVSFTLRGNTVTYYIVELVKKETENDVDHSVYSLSNGGYLLMSHAQTEPRSLIVTTMLDGGKVTTYYVNE